MNTVHGNVASYSLAESPMIYGEGRGPIGKIWCPAETTGVLRRIVPVMPSARRGIIGVYIVLRYVTYCMLSVSWGCRCYCPAQLPSLALGSSSNQWTKCYALWLPARVTYRWTVAWCSHLPRMKWRCRHLPKHKNISWMSLTVADRALHCAASMGPVSRIPGRQRQAWRASSPPLRSLPSTNCLAVCTRQLLPLRLLGDTGHLTGHWLCFPQGSFVSSKFITGLGWSL